MDRRNRMYHPLIMAAERIGSMQIPVYAANACYFLVLAVFPALLLLLASVRYLPYSADDLIELVSAALPAALVPAAEKLIVSTYYNSSGALMSVSAVAALWSASRGVHGLRTGLNHIYGVNEDRGYVATRVISAVHTLIFLIVLVLTLVIQVFGRSIADWFWNTDRPVLRLLIGIIDWRAVWLMVVQIVVFTVFYMVLPNRRNRFWDSLPGAAVASVGWLGLSNAFSIYVEHMDSYANIYGSVYMVALTMLWLYCCVCILLFGGGVNRLLQQWMKR